MSETKYPPGWDAERAKQLIEQYDRLSEDELAAEDDTAVAAQEGQAAG
ncbi:MAG: hypothetical protein K2P78_14470 [Gemmataceae bacterium]|nr:hypothetical protein [Gemmataceae bacterium]